MALDDHPMWRKPQHHQDLKKDYPHDHVHWVELFYDLVHVVTIFLLGNYLSHHLDWSGLLNFTLMFVVLWYAWGEISVYNSLYVSTDFWHRIIMSLAIVTVMFMAASIPSITGGGWPYFVVGFALNRAVIAFLYYRANLIGSEPSSLTNEMVRNFGFFAVYFAITAFLPRPVSQIMFIFGMVLTQAIYMIPKLTVIRFERFDPRWGHIAERFSLLTLIVIGESFFKLVVTLADKGIYKVGPEVLFNFTIGGVLTFIMAWTYFDFVGNKSIKNRNISTAVFYWLSHLLLMFSAVLVGVGLTAAVKVGFWEPYPTDYAAVGCFGLAGFLFALWVIQKQLDHHIAFKFASGKLRIFGISLAILTYFIVPHVPAIIGNLLWGTALMSQIFWPISRAHRHFSKEG